MPASPLAKWLFDRTSSCVDVQCGAERGNLMKYVTGYATKASDSLRFPPPEADGAGGHLKRSKWCTIFRLIGWVEPRRAIGTHCRKPNGIGR